MPVEDCNKLVVLDRSEAFVDVHFTHEAKVGHELSNSNVGRKLHDLGEQVRDLLL
jgi:hypothetical protein